MLTPLTCPNYGAPLDGAPKPGDVVTCGYCQVSHRVAGSVTPEPDMGDLLLGADFRDSSFPGWTVYEREGPSFVADPG